MSCDVGVKGTSCNGIGGPSEFVPPSVDSDLPRCDSDKVTGENLGSSQRLYVEIPGTYQDGRTLLDGSKAPIGGRGGDNIQDFFELNLNNMGQGTEIGPTTFSQWNGWSMSKKFRLLDKNGKVTCKDSGGLTTVGSARYDPKADPKDAWTCAASSQQNPNPACQKGNVGCQFLCRLNNEEDPTWLKERAYALGTDSDGPNDDYKLLNPWTCQVMDYPCKDRPCMKSYPWPAITGSCACTNVEDGVIAEFEVCPESI